MLKAELLNTQLQVKSQQEARKYEITVKLPPTSSGLQKIYLDLSTEGCSDTHLLEPSKTFSNISISSPDLCDSFSSLGLGRNATGGKSEDLPVQAKLLDTVSKISPEMKQTIRVQGSHRTNGATKVTGFSKLPLNIQRTNWRYSLPHHRRVVEFRHLNEYETKDTAYIATTLFCTLPIAFYVCQTARKEAMKTYEPCQYNPVYSRFKPSPYERTESAYLDYSMNTLLFTQSKKDTSDIKFVRFPPGLELSKIQKLAFDFETWNHFMETASWQSTLTAMKNLETLEILSDRGDVAPWLRSTEAIAALNLKAKDSPGSKRLIKNLIPKIRFRTLRRKFTGGKDYSANIEWFH